MTTSADQKAAKLLEMLQANHKESVEDLQLITPGMDAFLKASRKVTSALVDNVRTIKAIGQEKDQVVEDILTCKFKTKGTSSDNMRQFASTGAFTLYAQQYKRKKMPFITIPSIMEMMVVLWRHFNMTPLEALEGNSKADTLETFQWYLVQECKRFEEEHAMDYDFETMWRDAGLARGRLFKDPMYYAAQWRVFFDNGSPSVEPFVEDIDNALDYHNRLKSVGKKADAVDSNTRTIVDATTDLEIAANENLKIDQQINLLKDTSERNGGDVDTLKSAQELNASKVKLDLPVEELSFETHSRPTTEQLLQSLANTKVGEVVAPKKRKRAPTPKKRKRDECDAAPVARAGGKFAAMMAQKGKRPKVIDSDDESSSDDDDDDDDISSLSDGRGVGVKGGGKFAAVAAAAAATLTNQISFDELEVDLDLGKVSHPLDNLVETN